MTIIEYDKLNMLIDCINDMINDLDLDDEDNQEKIEYLTHLLSTILSYNKL